METIRIKPGVEFDPRTVGDPRFWVMAEAAQETAPAGYSITITSGCEGRHRVDSQHYEGEAIDIRIRDFPKKLGVWESRIQKRLGDSYYVLLEPTHLHIQRKKRS